MHIFTNFFQQYRRNISDEVVAQGNKAPAFARKGMMLDIKLIANFTTGWQSPEYPTMSDKD